MASIGPVSSCCLWFHHAVYGFIMLFVVSSCCLWFHHAVYGFIMLFMVSSCCLWFHHAVCGFIMLFMVSSCCLWFHHAVYGFIMLFMVSSCCLWFHHAVYGFFWLALPLGRRSRRSSRYTRIPSTVIRGENKCYKIFQVLRTKRKFDCNNLDKSYIVVVFAS